MREPMEGIVSALERDEGGVAIIRYPDFGLKEWLIGEVASVVPTGSSPVRKSDLSGALAEPDRLVLLVPNDEREVVLDLDGQRDRLLDRKQPIVLFLLRDGDGQRALAEDAPSLANWIRGSDTDPEALAQIDAASEREAFQRETGQSPEEWLEGWRNGDRTKTSQNLRTAYLAMLLEAP